MPNWCMNKVRIRADSKTLSEIKDTLRGLEYFRPVNCDDRKIQLPLESKESLFSFHKIIPQPDDCLDPEDPRRVNAKPTSDDLLESLSKKSNGTMPDWWTWRVNNWGTKWPVGDTVGFEEKKGSIVYHFDTAWSPPVPIIHRLSVMFPKANILLSFYEPGCIGRGSVTFKNGIIINETGVGVD